MNFTGNFKRSARTRNLRTYWSRRVVVPTVAICTTAFLILIFLLSNRTRSLEEKSLQAIVSTISFMVADPIQFGDHIEVLKRISAISGKHDLRMSVQDASGIEVASFPNSFHDEETRGARAHVTSQIFANDGRFLGTVDAQSDSSLVTFDLSFAGVLLVTLLVAFILVWVLQSTQPLIQDILKIEGADFTNGEESPEFFFIEMRSVYESLRIRSAEKLEMSKLATIAQTTQMIAHDVRKPFSTLKMVIDAIQLARDMNEMKVISTQMLPEVERAAAAVNGMLQDVMEIDSHALPVTELTSVENLIRTTLSEIFQIYHKANIDIHYDLQTKQMINVDILKINRVISNIVTNAIQALSFKGTIWFRAEELFEHGKGFLKFTIGNSGTPIPAEDIPHLFEAFFTRRKKGGTGLGLAIAQKIVLAHEGRLWCDSKEGLGVEFHMTLPLSHQASKQEAQLPTHSSGFVMGRKNFFVDNILCDEGEIDAELDGASVRIAVLDDSPTSLMVWSIKYRGNKVYTFENPDAFWRYYELNPSFLETLDCVVTDYEFGSLSTVNGLAFGERLKQKYQGPVFLASNSEFLLADLVGKVDAAIGKKIPEISHLREKIKAVILARENF